MADAPTLSLEKPLFDIEVCIDGENGYVLPDFIVKATMNDGKGSRVVIETMGIPMMTIVREKPNNIRECVRLAFSRPIPPGGHRKLRRLSKGISLVFFIISINDVVILSKQLALFTHYHLNT